MNCFRGGSSKNNYSWKDISPEATESMAEQDARKPKEELLLRVPRCTVHLIEEGGAMELAKGDFKLLKLSDENIFLAAVIKIGDDLQWPLTKDEPVLKLNPAHYLFSLPMKDGELMNYGVSFSGQFSSNMGVLDSFLKEHSCFSGTSSSNAYAAISWKEYAPRIEEYNGVVAKAIAEGTGEVVNGIFNCNDAYAKQVQKSGEMLMNSTIKKRNGTSTIGGMHSGRARGAKKGGLNKGLKRVRKLSKMTEKLSKSLLNGVELASGSMVAPVFHSRPGKAMLSSIPGEVLLASLNIVDKVLDAAEAAEKRAFSATSGAATRMVNKRLGENAGEATEDILATAGHCAGTAWNIFKIRKALTPSSAMSSAIVQSAGAARKKKL